MVFFCGAGISVPTGLPTFRGLVSALYSSLHVEPDTHEKALIEANQFDEALGALEGRLTGGALRQEVARLFSRQPEPGTLGLHRALLGVSGDHNGIRLVTTNYDDNFARAAGENPLPVRAGEEPPDFGNWNSVFHLHGRIPASGSDGSGLVLTDADFGKAYLRSGWAARFVAGLMERFDIVFVGYRMGDMVVRYLTRGMQSTGGARAIYSFVGYPDEAARRERESKWEEFGVTPILYDSRNNHALLVESIKEWARFASDPVPYRVKIAVSGLAQEPNREVHDACPDRVVWALSEPAAIWPAFQRIRNAPDPGPTAAAWLEVFAERGLAGPLIANASAPQDPRHGSIAQAVAFWIEIHAHAPEILAWMVGRRSYLHADLRRRLWDRLTSTDRDQPAIPDRLARLWALLLAEPPEDPDFSRRPDQLVESLERLAPEAADDILLSVLRPRLGVLSGPDPYRSTVADQDATPEEIAIRNCAHTEVVLGYRDRRWRDNVLAEIQPSRHAGFLRRHAVTLTEYLKSAFTLLERSDRADARYVHDLLGDGDDEGVLLVEGVPAKRTRGRRQRWRHGLVGAWTILLDWVNESYRALPPGDTQRSELLRSWIGSEQPTLWRLALGAVLADDTADFEIVGPVLLRRDQQMLWGFPYEREVLPILRQADKRGSQALQTKLLDALQQRGASSPQDDPRMLATVGPRLAALSGGGVELPESAARTLAVFQEHRRASGSEPAPRALTGRIREVAAALETGEVSAKIFEEFARRRPVGALLALKVLNDKGRHPNTLWEKTLDLAQHLVNKERLRRLPRLAEFLLRLPDELFHKLQFGISRLLDHVAGVWPHDGGDEFWRLWRRGWEHRSQDSGVLSPVDALTHAMNTTAGCYASAALKRIVSERARSASISENHLATLGLIVQDDSGSAGLVMLTFHLEWLYANATEWTERAILPRLRWAHRSASDDADQETRALWDTLAFHGSMPLTLARVLGADLWTAIERHKEFYRGKNLARFFVRLSIADIPDLIAADVCRKTARAVIRDSPLQVAVVFRRLLDQDEAQRGTTWKTMVRPWLQNYWPKEKDLNTAGSSAAIVEFIAGTGDAFPDAVEWANGYVVPLDDQQIGTIWHNKDAWQSHPRAAVTLLHRIVPTHGIDPWTRAPLDEMLKAMKKADATISQDPRYQELQRRAAI